MKEKKELKHTRIHIHIRNILPHLRLLSGINPKPLVPILTQLTQPPLLRQLHSLLRDKAPHQHRRAQRQRIAAIHLPKVVRLAVQRRHVVHLGRLGRVPRDVGHHCGRGHDEHAALDFEFVRVPEVFFFFGERAEEARGDHVFEADEARVGVGGVVEEALSDVFIYIALTFLSFLSFFLSSFLSSFLFFFLFYCRGKTR